MQAEPPRLVGIRFGPALAAALYLLLVCSAILALWSWRFPGGIPSQIEHAAPWAFLVFLGAFALYRFELVRAGRYRASKAFFQIGSGVLLFTLLLPQARTPYQRAPASSDLVELLVSPDPRVRAVAAEVARHRPDGQRYAHQLAEALEDADPDVRQQAHTSLVLLTGIDLGDPSSPDSVRAWTEHFP